MALLQKPDFKPFCKRAKEKSAKAVKKKGDYPLDAVRPMSHAQDAGLLSDRAAMHSSQATQGGAHMSDANSRWKDFEEFGEKAGPTKSGPPHLWRG